MADMGSRSIMMSNQAQQWSMKSCRSFLITPTQRKILACNSNKPKQPTTPKPETTETTQQSTTNDST